MLSLSTVSSLHMTFCCRAGPPRSRNIPTEFSREAFPGLDGPASESDGVGVMVRVLEALSLGLMLGWEDDMVSVCW